MTLRRKTKGSSRYATLRLARRPTSRASALVAVVATSEFMGIAATPFVAFQDRAKLFRKDRGSEKDGLRLRPEQQQRGTPADCRIPECLRSLAEQCFSMRAQCVWLRQLWPCSLLRLRT